MLPPTSLRLPLNRGPAGSGADQAPMVASSRTSPSTEMATARGAEAHRTQSGDPAGAK